MKKVHIWSIVVFLLAIFGAVVAAIMFGQKTPIIVAGQVSISSQLEADANNLSDLFIVIYDENSPRPMPYGAIRYRLDAPARGGFYNFVITTDNLQRMVPDAPVPSSLRLKARLDVDGRAGMDQPGDLVGELRKVTAGSSGLELKIQSKI